MDDLISRKTAIDAVNTWDWQELYLPIHFKQLLEELPSAQLSDFVAQKKRYAFGRDEFNLEYAYHDCKLVFDEITDDKSFQEADSGLIFYYANEIIYALQEALMRSEDGGLK